MAYIYVARKPHGSLEARYTAMVVLPILLLLLGSSPASRAADEELELTVLDVTLLEPRASCSGHRVMPPHNNSWVPLFRALGPCSPSFKAAAAAARAKPSLADVLRQDRLRVHHIHRRVSGSRGARASKGFAKEPMSVEETQLHHQAAISAELGSALPSSEPSSSIRPAATEGSSSPSVTVVLDTAGDVPWIRCVPCALAQCPDYDPTRSSTYKAFPCNSSECKQLGRYANGCDANGQCQYIVTGNSTDSFTTSGTYSSDVLTINSASVRSFRFGCSQNEQGSFENQADGIMALGRGVQSLMAQTSSTYGDAFSYCLPPTETTKGFFQLGVPIGASYRFVTTPMLKERGAAATTQYRVLLVAITVDGKALNVPPEVFAAGTVMDSRTIITRLPVTAYGALRAAFRNRMRYRAAPRQEDLDTCYDLTGVRYPRLPRIALVFDGNAVVEMDRSGILLNGCLAFASNDDDSKASILGNVQQQTIQVLHDVGGGRIGFRSAAC